MRAAETPWRCASWKLGIADEPIPALDVTTRGCYRAKRGRGRVGRGSCGLLG
jgi:hypothetical protein